MGHEQTSESVANHSAIECKLFYDLLTCAGCVHCWVWATQDYAVEVAQLETFGLAFGTRQLAMAINVAFDNAKTSNETANIDIEHVESISLLGI